MPVLALVSRIAVIGKIVDVLVMCLLYLLIFCGLIAAPLMLAARVFGETRTTHWTEIPGLLAIMLLVATLALALILSAH